MKPAAFEYRRVGSVAEAIAALSGGDAKIIAGGQSLVPMMNFRLAQPGLLVDINQVPGLSEISETAGHLSFGALVRHAQALNSKLVARHLPVIREAMRHVAHLAIRNRGTIGGSLVHADPSAEWPLLATLLDAKLEIEGPEGKRCVATGEFFEAPLVTAVGEDELLTAVHFPLPAPGAGMAFDEMSQRAGDFALVAAGALVKVEAGRIAEARLALGGVGGAPVRVRAVEERLAGAEASAETIAAAAKLALDGLEPMSDLHASAEFRLHLVPVMARRVLVKALEWSGR